MKLEIVVNTRVCYWQHTSLLEVYYEPFEGIIRCIDVPAPEIHFTKNVSLIFPCPVITDIVRDDTSEQLVMNIYPTPKD